jgi:hypothetical protein
LSLNDQLDVFFKRFTPWENEQLACVLAILLEELKLGMVSLHLE